MTTIIGAGFITAEVLNGLGRHQYYLTPSQRRNFQAVGWADWVQIFITLCLTKVSICLFLLRIVDSRQVVRGMYVLIGFMVLFSSVFVFLFLGICRPLKAYWDVGVSGSCFSNPQVESIVIAQGGMIPPLSSEAALLTISCSLVHHYRFGLCCFAVHLSPKPTDQQNDQDWVVYPHVPGSHVGPLLAPEALITLIGPQNCHLLYGPHLFVWSND